MIYTISDNIISPLGFTADDTYIALKAGRIGGALHTHTFDLPEPFFGSLLPWQRIENEFAQLPNANALRYTRFEKLMLLSAIRAVKQANIDAARPDVLFVLSTTKGNVDLLADAQGFAPERAHLWKSAQLLAAYFGNPNEPVVVSNACISGVAAQKAACDALLHRNYQYAVVVGADVLSKFVVSGFQSFKALSPEQCKPFDAHRCGLNLGEAAATLVLGRTDKAENLPAGTFVCRGAALRNDANHISGPSRTGEGLFHAIDRATQGFDKSKIAFVNAHGTATPYNDDMESFGIARAGLQNTPVNSLKGYLGHTLGAAGVLECIVSMHAIADGNILPTAGHSTFGVVNPICVNTTNTPCTQKAFIKIISGFGGSNAAIIYEQA